MIQYQFTNTKDKLFASTLRKRVNEFFSTTQGNTKANGKMRMKTLVSLAFYIVPYLIVVLLTPAI